MEKDLFPQSFPWFFKSYQNVMKIANCTEKVFFPLNLTDSSLESFQNAEIFCEDFHERSGGCRWMGVEQIGGNFSKDRKRIRNFASG